MAPDIIDIDELVKKWAKSFPLEKDQKCLAAEQILSTDINWKHFKVTHQPPKYDDERQAQRPMTHVLFTAVFSNNTDSSQVYSFNTERKTKSSCTVDISRGYVFDSHFDIKLAPPNPVIEANAGFRKELSLSRSDGGMIEEELTWSVDSQVQVPAMKKTTAALVIKEGEYSGKFVIKSTFNGKVHVSIRNRKDNSVLLTLTGKAKDIFTKENGFMLEKGVPFGITQGVCQCRYGIEQHVKLTQTDIKEEEMAGEQNGEL